MKDSVETHLEEQKVGTAAPASFARKALGAQRQGWSPGLRAYNPSLPPAFPGKRRVALAWRELPDYSGGTAPDFHRLLITSPHAFHMASNR